MFHSFTFLNKMITNFKLKPYLPSLSFFFANFDPLFGSFEVSYRGCKFWEFSVNFPRLLELNKISSRPIWRAIGKPMDRAHSGEWHYSSNKVIFHGDINLVTELTTYPCALHKCLEQTDVFTKSVWREKETTFEIRVHIQHL